MPTLTIRDNAVWIKHIEADETTINLLSQWPAGSRIHMEVDGVKGEWEKMADGLDGRPTNGIKPVGAMRSHWQNMQDRRGEIVTFQILERKDTYLPAVQAMLTEWESAEDESAFRDL
jgi:hypothetical protein